MLWYIVRRVLQALLAIFGIISVLFVLLHASSDPALESRHVTIRADAEPRFERWD